MPTNIRIVTSRGAIHDLTVEEAPQDLVSFINGSLPDTHLVFVGVTGNVVMVRACDLSSADLDVAKGGV